ncbi:MAG: hypothetical protein KDA75_01540 [Planctomycetaceae bacterium]|nr:hypothetical protein [Planctomycetaceae bacterium]
MAQWLHLRSAAHCLACPVLVGLIASASVSAESSFVAPDTGINLAGISSSNSDLPPLPPRDPNAPASIPRLEADRPQPVRTTIGVVVSEVAEEEESPIQSLGWSSASLPTASPDDAESGGYLPLPPRQAGDPLTEVLTRSTSSKTVIEPQGDLYTLPLVADGTFPCETVFDGVAVLTSSLAPMAMNADDESLAAELAGVYALAQETLGAPREFAAPLASPSPIDDEADDDQSESLTPQRQEQLAHAASDLFKPVQAISLTSGLHDREPEDLASVAVPSGPPRLVWGEPWPDARLSCYRYTYPFQHRPLYFEQPNFERCGTTCGLFSPYVSAAHFAGSVVTLPLHMLLEPPWNCVSTLGDCPTCHRYGFCPTLNR